MTDVIQWYVAIQLVGLAGLPLCLRAFRSLPDRGFAFARPLGLFIAGYVVWLGTILGFLTNEAATSAVVVVLIGAAGWLLLGDSRDALSRLWRERRTALVATEVIFLVGFLFWALYRSYVPDIANTEKPMEFAFLNSILRSTSFPPADPWLAGYSISYYYLGYLLTAILVQLSAVSASVGFNLMIATLFALTATGAFSLGYNLVAGLRERLAPMAPGPRQGIGPGAFGLLGALFAVLLTNWEGFLEILYSHGIGSSSFWSGIGIDGLTRAFQSAAWYPADPATPWWWFRASRVIGTYAADGKALDYTINEFPFFSFLLGDLHPHVLALPFATLALSFALAMVRGSGADWSWLGRPIGPDWLLRTRLPRWLGSYLYLYPREALRRDPLGTLLVWVFFGGLSFLNAWDLPTYLFILVGAFAIPRYLARRRFDATFWREILTFAWIALIGAVILYLPFYVGFRSQTAGIGVVPIRSQLQHYLIFWGPLLLIVGSFLVVQLAWPVLSLLREGIPQGTKSTAWRGIWVPVIALCALVLILELPPVRSAVSLPIQASALLLIAPLLAASAVALRRYLGGSEDSTAMERAPSVPSGSRQRTANAAEGAATLAVAPEHAFVLFLAFTALLLLFGTEWVFIRDLFNNRMNTVFKLYYQAWTLLAAVAAYAVYYLLGRLPRLGSPRIGAFAWGALCVVSVAAALVYVPASISSRVNEGSLAPTLDGTAYLAVRDPGDYDAIQWLRESVVGTPTIVEASGGSYTEAGRVSANTGLPTLLGWEFHEQQWRGTFEEASRRAAIVQQIYQSQDRVAVSQLLDEYNVVYVYVGPLENETYGAQDPSALTKFSDFMDVVYNEGGVVIYRTKG